MISKTFQLDRIIDRIKTGKILNIGFLTGAGISCSSGIPDFRSAGGMYDTLNPDLLTATNEEKELLRNDPVNVVNIEMFKLNQFPYLEVRRPFILGTKEKMWKPTLSHYFIKILQNKGLLKRVYTQNIDGLDYYLDLPDDKIIPVHGTISKIECEFCKISYPFDKFCEELKSNIKDIYDSTSDSPKFSTNIVCPSCNKNGIKPSTVMYGTSLPKIFFESLEKDFPDNIDLLIVVGTSLTVSPACNLVQYVNSNVPRIVINKERVGENLGLEYDNPDKEDIHMPSECDIAFLHLAMQLGFIDELQTFKKHMCEYSQSLLNQL